MSPEELRTSEHQQSENLSKRNFCRRQMATAFPLPNSRSTEVQAPHHHSGPKEPGQHILPTPPKLLKPNGNEQEKGDSSHPPPPTFTPKSSFPSDVLPRLFYLSGCQISPECHHVTD